MRLDVYLVENNFADSRTRAQEMIRAGQIQIIRFGNKFQALKPNENIQLGDKVIAQPGFATEFVSRSGHKLKYAVQKIAINIKGLKCLDVGVSTGGFSDYLLQNQAEFVLGVDVGIDQTHEKIKNNSKFKLIEKLNAKNLADSDQFKSLVPIGGFDFVVMDVSFISSLLVLPNVIPFAKLGAAWLVLVKPQFELGPDALNENGIVKDSKQHLELKNTYLEKATQIGLKCLDYFPSEIAGKDGNQEYFLYATTDF